MTHEMGDLPLILRHEGRKQNTMSSVFLNGKPLCLRSLEQGSHGGQLNHEVYWQSWKEKI